MRIYIILYFYRNEATLTLIINYIFIRMIKYNNLTSCIDSDSRKNTGK